MENNVVNEQSSNVHPILGKDIHAQLLYDSDLHLPLSSPEFDGLSVSVSPPTHNNALHLHLPPPSRDIHLIEPSVAVLPDPEGYLENSSLNLEPEPELTNAAPTHRPPPRVRFRSRVRIASGVHHHNHNHKHDSNSHLTSHSTDSVDSESSPCSSISAPLRYTPDDSDARPSYSFASAAGTSKSSKRRRSRRRGSLGGIAANVVTELPGPSERAPLLRAPGSRLGARTRRLYGELDADADGDEEETRGGVVSEAGDGFGRWPWRLFNGYWWAWKCGTIVSCCCPADDEED